MEAEQLARVSVYSSVRLTSCCCASWRRAALHQRLLETAGGRRIVRSIQVLSCVI